MEYIPSEAKRTLSEERKYELAKAKRILEKFKKIESNTPMYCTTYKGTKVCAKTEERLNEIVEQLKKTGKIMTNMTLNQYQEEALKTAIYPEDKKIIYPTLGLTGEAGEVAEKVKKVIRDNNQEFTDEKKRQIALEISDVLWYCATLSHDIGYTLGEIGKMNIDKLASRQQRNKIGGSGDER